VRDYLRAGTTEDDVRQLLGRLAQLTSTELLDLAAVAKIMGYSVVGDALDSAVSPQGYRLLSKVPRLPGAIVDRLVDHFGSLQKLLAANLEDLMAVEGVGEGRARAVREGLSRLAESSILERYV
jgi:diadenylate cyclase